MSGVQKVLGKITRAKFGMNRDYPFLMGLELEFGADGWGIGDGGKMMINVGPTAKWESSLARERAIARMIDSIRDLLIDAKVDDVTKLVGRPVEVTMEGNVFKDFRILKEVL